MQQPDAFQTRKLLTIQFFLGVLFTVSSLPFGSSVAVSVLIGSGSCLLANALFAAWVFRVYRAQEPDRLVKRFYTGEVVKITLVLGLFAVAIAVYDKLNLPALLGAYVAIQVIPIFIAAQLGNRNMK